MGWARDRGGWRIFDDEPDRDDAARTPAHICHSVLPTANANVHTNANATADAASVIFCEATAIYGVILAIILLTKVQTKDLAATLPADWENDQFYFAGALQYFDEGGADTAAAAPAGALRIRRATALVLKPGRDTDPNSLPLSLAPTHAHPQATPSSLRA